MGERSKGLIIHNKKAVADSKAKIVPLGTED